MVLSPELFETLSRHFDPIRIANEGQPAEVRRRLDLRGRPDSETLSGGEEYIVVCPFCGDRTGHLYINHRYGSLDPDEGSDNYHLAHCFRRDCLRDNDNRRRLADFLFGEMPADRRPIVPQARFVNQRPAPTSRLGPAEPPGIIHSLTALAPDHKARKYLADRAYDVEELVKKWNVGFCGAPGNPHAVNRIYVPIFRRGVLVGWITRLPGACNLQTKWIRKYYNMTGLRKKLLLYNHDLALQQSFVVICEGVTDVWRVGAPGVAIFGKIASTEQIQLLAAGWRNKPALVLLDADAADESKKLYGQLKPYFRDLLVRVVLPKDYDPGICPRDVLWQFICQEATAQGVALLGPAGYRLLPLQAPGT